MDVIGVLNDGAGIWDSCLLFIGGKEATIHNIFMNWFTDLDTCE